MVRYYSRVFDILTINVYLFIKFPPIDRKDKAERLRLSIEIGAEQIDSKSIFFKTKFKIISIDFSRSLQIT